MKLVEFKLLNQKNRFEYLESLIELCDPSDLRFIHNQLLKRNVSFDILSSLPTYITNQVAQYLDLNDLLTIQVVSKNWYNIIQSDEVWNFTFHKICLDLSFNPTLIVPELKQQRSWKLKCRYLIERDHSWNYKFPIFEQLVKSNSKVIATHFHRDMLFYATSDRLLYIFNLKTKNHMYSPIETNMLTCISYHEDLDLIVTGSFTREVKIYSLATLECLKTLTGHTNAISSLILHDQTLISAGSDGILNFWDVLTGTRLNMIRAHNQKILSIQRLNEGLFASISHMELCTWSWIGDHVRTYNFHQSIKCFTVWDTSLFLCQEGIINSYNISKSGDLKHQSAQFIKFPVSNICGNNGYVITYHDGCEINVWRMGPFHHLQLLLERRGVYMHGQLAVIGEHVYVIEDMEIGMFDFTVKLNPPVTKGS